MKRALKRLGASFRRVRRIPPKSPPASQVGRVQRVLARLHRLEEQGKCHVWYGDESGFCLQPPLPYLWQAKGQTLGVPSSAHSKRLNVLGFVRRDGALHSVTFTHTMKAQQFIDTIEAWLPHLTRPAVLVLDNASVHRSQAVREKRREWKARGLRLLFLPPYSPQMNCIEILWRTIKYHWLPPQAYLSFATLCQGVKDILAQIGTKYQISFA